MWTLLAGVSIFILYITTSWSIHAQSILIQDTSSPVLHYLDRFLNLNPKRSTSEAYSTGNKAFFEWFRNNLAKLPEEDHIRGLSYTIKQLEKMDVDQVKATYNLDKHIWVALLQWIYEMSLKDISLTEDSTNSDESATNGSDKELANELYEIQSREYNDDTYYMLTLIQPNKIKNADFHADHGSFYHCMYEQCNTLIFKKSDGLKAIHVTYTLWGSSETISFTDAKLSKKTSPLTTSKTNDAEDNETHELTTTTSETQQSTSTQTTTGSGEIIWEADLLDELSELFWDIL